MGMLYSCVSKNDVAGLLDGLLGMSEWAAGGRRPCLSAAACIRDEKEGMGGWHGKGWPWSWINVVSIGIL